MNLLRKSIQNERKLYDYQEYLMKINRINVKSYDFQVNVPVDIPYGSCINYNDTLVNLLQILFKTSECKLSRKTIGYLIPSNIDNEILKDKFENSSPQTISLSINPSDLCVMPSFELLIIDNKKSLNVYDEEFNLKRVIDKINDQSFYPIRLATNNKDRFYISDSTNYEVIALDFNFNKIKSFGSKGAANDQFDFPNGISYSNECVYVCDLDNKRIQKLSKDLIFLETIQLDYKPWLIKSSDTLACIASFDHTSTYFYDLKNQFQLKFKYDDECYGRISEINSSFYVYKVVDKKIKFYNSNGEFVETFDVDRLGTNIKDSADGVLAFYMERIIVTCQNKRKLILI